MLRRRFGPDCPGLLIADKFGGSFQPGVTFGGKGPPAPGGNIGGPEAVKRIK